MSAIYQDQEFVITEQDLAQVEQELNPSDDFQSLIIAQSSINQPFEAHEDDFYSELEDYMLNLEKRWEEPVKELTQEQEDILWEESYRLESDILETEENYL